MIRAASLTALLCLAPIAAGAETATIRSGEHPGHSRIVVEPGERTGWAIGRTEGGYELRFDRAGIDFDTARVFARIPRARLAALEQAGDSRLSLTVAPGHHLRAFETARGVAIDIYPGPAPEGSPYEVPLDAATGTVAEGPPEPLAPEAAPLLAQTEPLAPEVATAAASLVPVAPLLAPTPEPEQPAAVVAQPAAPGAPRPRQRPEVVAAMAAAAAAVRAVVPLMEPAEPAPVAVVEPDPEPEAAAPLPVAQAPEPAPEPAAEPLRPLAQSFRRPVGIDPRLDLYWNRTLNPASAQPEAEVAEVAPEAAAPVPAPREVPVTLGVNPRIAATETELLRQLSRAAAQGLVRAEVPEFRATPAPLPGTATADAAPAAVAEEPVRPRSLTDHLNVRTNTSIDRELLSLARGGPVTSDGRECLPDEAVDLGGWGDGRPMLIQLVEARDGLVGEFDRPDPAIADKLAKLYLHFGFGAEARQTLVTFGTPGEEADVLTEIAAILDYGHAAPDGILAGMADCDTAAALWGILAQEDIGPGDTVNEAAAFRAFSALPLHLRHMLGELLADRFLQMGTPDRARAVRDAILRAPGEHGIAVSMINARLELAEGDLRAAEPHLEDVARANGPGAVEAVILHVEGRLTDGLPADMAMVENAGALAFAMKGAPEAAALERAHVLGLASNADFGEAFAALALWRKDGLDPLQAQVKDELFAMLAAPEAGQLFLTHYFANRDLIRPEEASNELRFALSERLLSFGFTDEARRMRGAEAAETETGRLFLARAALADYDGAETLRLLSGFDGTEARRLRAEALRLLGRHEEAAVAYLAAGAPEEAGSEAWRAGSWENVAELDDGVRREAVAAFGLVPGIAPPPLAPPPEPGPDGTPPGPLAQNRALIEESRAARALLDALLADAGPIAEGG